MINFNNLFEKSKQKDEDILELTEPLEDTKQETQKETETQTEPKQQSMSQDDILLLLANEIRNIKKELRAEKEQNNLHNAIITAEQEFLKAQADYPQAVAFYKTSRYQDFATLGIEDETYIKDVIQNELLMVAQTALAHQKNPGFCLYNLAINRGYKPEKEEHVEEEKKEETPPPQEDKKETLKDKTTSLSQFSGIVETPLSADRVNYLSDAEFKQTWNHFVNH